MTSRAAAFLNNYSYDSLDRLTQGTQAQQAGGNTVAAKRVNFAFNADGQYTSIPGAPGPARWGRTTAEIGRAHV